MLDNDKNSIKIYGGKIMQKKFSFKEMLCYALGDVGCNFVWATVGSFLMLYYTNSVGISAAATGTLMLITRLLDGVSDLIAGSIIDRTKTKWGKARPWLLWTAPFMGIGLVLLFSVPDSLPSGGKLVYAYVTYILMAAVIYTACNLAYTTLLSLITPEPEIRSKISAIRFFLVVIAMLVISYAVTPLVEKVGWVGMAVVFGVLGCALLLICFAGTKERISENQKENDSQFQEKLSIAQSFMLLFKNKYFILVAILFVLTYISGGVTNGSGVYYATYILGNGNLFGNLMLFGILPGLVFILLIPKMNRLLGKWKLLLLSYAIQIIGFILIALFPSNLPMLYFALVVKAFGQTAPMSLIFALAADVVDYGELKTGKRIDGLTYSAVSFGMKVGTGIGTAIVGWALAFGHFDGMAAVQPESALTAVKALYSYIPIVIGVITLFVMYLTNVDKANSKLRENQQEVK